MCQINFYESCKYRFDIAKKGTYMLMKMKMMKSLILNLQISSKIDLNWYTNQVF